MPASDHTTSSDSHHKMAFVSTLTALLSFSIYLLLLPYALLFRTLAAAFPLSVPWTFAEFYSLLEAAERAIYSVLCSVYELFQPSESRTCRLAQTDAVLFASTAGCEDFLLNVAESRVVLVLDEKENNSEANRKRLAALAGAHASNLVFLKDSGAAQSWLAEHNLILGAAILPITSPKQPDSVTRMPVPRDLESRLNETHGLITALAPLLQNGRIIVLLPPRISGAPNSTSLRVENAAVKSLLDSLQNESAPLGSPHISTIEPGTIRLQRRGSLRRASISEDPKAVAPERDAWKIPGVSPAEIQSALKHALDAKWPMQHYAIGLDIKLERIKRVWSG